MRQPNTTSEPNHGVDVIPIEEDLDPNETAKYAQLMQQQKPSECDAALRMPRRRRVLM